MISEELAYLWVRQALELEPGDEVYISCVDKSSQKEVLKLMKKTIGKLAQVNPLEACRVKTFPRWADGAAWVGIRRINADPLVGYKKSANGKVERIELDADPEKDRREWLMRQAGYTEEEIREMEGGEGDD